MFNIFLFFNIKNTTFKINILYLPLGVPWPKTKLFKKQTETTDLLPSTHHHTSWSLLEEKHLYISKTNAVQLKVISILWTMNQCHLVRRKEKFSFNKSKREKLHPVSLLPQHWRRYMVHSLQWWTWLSHSDSHEICNFLI